MKVASISKNSIFSLNLAKKLVGTLIFIICFELLLFPAPLIAEETGILANDWGNIASVDIKPALKEVFLGTLPSSTDLDIHWRGYYSMTAYN